ncbi:MAG: Maf family protein [Anaerolineae bacterium]
MSLPYPLILASGSPRRRELLSLFDLPFSVRTADIDETPHPHEPPEALACRLSRHKARAVARRHPRALIIAADTIVVLNHRILGKPAHPAQAKTMLMRLRGKDHHVYSAITLMQAQTARTHTTLSVTTVSMRPYTPADVDAYVASGDPMDKAGAYAIQNRQFEPVAAINGCYAGVMGFPLGHLADGLARFGFAVPNVNRRCAGYTGQPCCYPAPTQR